MYSFPDLEPICYSLRCHDDTEKCLKGKIYPEFYCRVNTAFISSDAVLVLIYTGTLTHSCNHNISIYTHFSVMKCVAIIYKILISDG